jgi:hypothetical protein
MIDFVRFRITITLTRDVAGSDLCATMFGGFASLREDDRLGVHDSLPDELMVVSGDCCKILFRKQQDQTPCVTVPRRVAVLARSLRHFFFGVSGPSVAKSAHEDRVVAIQLR